MSQVYIVFGAADPEREAAMRLAQDVGVAMALATADGQPVSPESAYRADGFRPLSRDLEPGDVALLFECDGPELRGLLDDQYFGGQRRVILLDHHRPGDPGWGKPPKEFLVASSLGQLIHRLAAHDLLPRHYKWHDAGPDFTWPLQVYLDYGESHSLGDICWRSNNTYCKYLLHCDLIYAAAADHCLAAAYRGECPGVGPDALLHWRARSRARSEKRDPTALLAAVNLAREWLRAKKHINLGGEVVVDMRELFMPELPEAAARESVAFVTTPPVRPGERQIVVLQCAGPAALAAWPRWAKEQGLVDLYGGDPDSGFAGGYYPY